MKAFKCLICGPHRRKIDKPSTNWLKSEFSQSKCKLPVGTSLGNENEYASNLIIWWCIFEAKTCFSMRVLGLWGAAWIKVLYAHKFLEFKYCRRALNNHVSISRLAEVCANVCGVGWGGVELVYTGMKHTFVSGNIFHFFECIFKA